MSAGRNASAFLITLVATAILFGVFAGISSLKVLERHAYMPGFGWEEPAVNTSAGLIGGVCDVSTATEGFPIANTRQAAPPNDCQKAHNPLARYMNFALYFAAATIIAVAVVERIKDRL